MSKKRRTREQKITGDLRRQLLLPPSQPQPAQLLTSNTYLLGDLTKTVVVVGLLVGAELMLFILLQGR